MFRTMEGGLGPPQKDIRGTGACAVGQKRVGTCSDGKKTFGQVRVGQVRVGQVRVGQVRVGQGGRTNSCKTSIIPGGNMYTQYTLYNIHVACMTGPPSTLYTVHIEKRVQVMKAVPGGGLYAVQHAWGRSISIMDTRGGYLCPYMGITSPRQQICPPQNRFHTVQKVILISAI